MQTWTDRAIAAAQVIQDRVPHVPQVGVILGTGLGVVANELADSVSLETDSIPHFPRSTVNGHAGRLIVGTWGNQPIAVLSGRVHAYEGYEPALLGFPVRVLHALGIRTLITTNAAGALNPEFAPGDVMVIEDHLSFPSLAGRGPLVASVPEPGLRRFVDLTNAYARDLREIAEIVASEAAIRLRKGIYIMVGGPNFETPAEVRFLQQIGGDAVGMSTVPEVIVARQLNLPVLGLSVMSNMAAGLPGALLDHDDVMEAMGRAAPDVARIIRGVVARLRR